MNIPCLQKSLLYMFLLFVLYFTLFYGLAWFSPPGITNVITFQPYPRTSSQTHEEEQVIYSLNRSSSRLIQQVKNNDIPEVASKTSSQFIAYYLKKRQKKNEITNVIKMIDAESQQPFQKRMSFKDVNIMKDLIQTFIQAIKAARLTYFMYGGTLIGSIRHHGFIPWDDDFDVIVKYAHKHQLYRIISALPPQYRLYSGRTDRWKFFSTQSHPIKNVQWNYPFLDISFYKENATHVWDADPYFAETFCYDRSLVFPLVDRPFEKIMLKAPHDTTAFLSKNYNISMCQSNKYNHKEEQFIKKHILTINCKKLWNMYPFVFRENNVEILKIENKILSMFTPYK